MKLSEAIRIGAQNTEFIRYELVKTNGNIKACALGCAGIAAIPNFDTSNPVRRYDALTDTFPELKHVISNSGEQLMTCIGFRNDYTRMTREEIADWVEAQGY